jgi:hypothetical protein
MYFPSEDEDRFYKNSKDTLFLFLEKRFCVYRDSLKKYRNKINLLS